MSDEEIFVDYATVREILLDAQDRRGFLTYEQKAALQHAEWAASDARNGYRTDPEVFLATFEALMGIEKFDKYPELAAKLAELMPMTEDDVRAVLASRRITVENDVITQTLDIVRQQVGVE